MLSEDKRNSVGQRSLKSSAHRRSEDQQLARDQRRAVLPGDQRNRVVEKTAKNSAANRSENQC